MDVGGDLGVLLDLPADLAASVEFFPIICITHPCPGQWGNVSSMDILASNIPGGTLAVSNGYKLFSVTGQPTPVGEASNEQYHGWGTGSAQIEEFCDALPPTTCAASERKLQVTNIGSSGQDGVCFDLGSAETLRANGIVHRDIAARNIGLYVSSVAGG